MTVKFIFIIPFLLIACRSAYLHIPPVLNNKEVSSFTYELKYIESTDQRDRKKGRFHILFNTKKGQQIGVRDSIRGKRVFEIYTDEKPKTDEDKFIIGLIFMHSPFEGHLALAYSVFEDLELNGKLKNTRRNGENWKEIVVKYKGYVPEK